MYRVLVCDDDKAIVDAAAIYLQSEGYEVVRAYNGKEAVALAKSETLHCIIMDIMMPEMDGIETLSRIRETSNVPVIFLTAKSEDTDKILGLTVGADDYVTKPFNPVEVQARVRSQLRRYMMLGGGKRSEDVLVFGGLELNDRSKEIFVDGEPATLTPKEYEILKLLMENPGKVFSPAEIYQQVWKDSPLGAENTVAVHIRHLREKIEIDPANPRYIRVVWGHGYRMEEQKR